MKNFVHKNFCLVMIFIAAMFAGCAKPQGVIVDKGHTAITIPNEQIEAMPSVDSASKKLAEEVKKKWGGKSVVVGYFTRLDNGKRNLLCQQLEKYLKNDLQVGEINIDNDTLEKLQKYFRMVASPAFNPDYAISGFLKDAHCLLTGTLDLQKSKNIIYIIVEAYDNQEGNKLLGTRIPIDYSNPDVKYAWETEIDDPKPEPKQVYKQPIKPEPTIIKPDISQPVPEPSIPEQPTYTYTNPPRLSDVIEIKRQGSGKNTYLAYEAAKVIVNLEFTEKYVSQILESDFNMGDGEMREKIIKSQFKGVVPPRIEYTPEDMVKFDKCKDNPNLWCAYVTGKIERNQFVHWIRTKMQSSNY